MKSEWKANIMMLIATVIWGSSYLFMKIGLSDIEAFNLIALRFLIGFLFAGALIYRRWSKLDLQMVKSAFIMGTLLFLSFTSLTFGLKTTSASSAGFLISLTVIFVPLVLAVMRRKMPELKVMIGVLLALTGIGLLTIKSELTFNIGDLLCIIGAFIYAFHIIATGKLTQKCDALTLGVLQLAFTGAWGLVGSFIFEQPHLPSTSNAWIAVLGLSVLCSAIGFVLQTLAQKYTTPTHTGLLFSLEPVFAASFAYIFVGETLSFKGYIGAALILLSVFIAQLNWRFARKKATQLTS